MSGAQVTITLTAEAVLNEDECWPDGAPDHWDAQDILESLAEQGVSAWDLDAYGFRCEVIATRPNPAWDPTPPLLPDHAPERNHTTCAKGTVR